MKKSIILLKKWCKKVFLEKIFLKLILSLLITPFVPQFIFNVGQRMRFNDFITRAVLLSVLLIAINYILISVIFYVVSLIRNSKSKKIKVLSLLALLIFILVSLTEVFVLTYVTLRYGKYENSASKQISSRYRGAINRYCDFIPFSSCRLSALCSIQQMDCMSGCITTCRMKQTKDLSPISDTLIHMTPAFIFKRQYETLDTTTLDPECRKSHSWERRGSFYIKESNVCFNARRYYPDIDGVSFKYLNHTYVRDKNHIYVFDELKDDEYGAKVQILNADPDTFEPIGHYTVYAKDKKHIYGCGRVINDADINTFEFIGDDFAKDKNHVYKEARSYNTLRIPNCAVGMIKGADPKTFNIKEYQKENKNNYKEDNLMLYL